MGAQRNSKRMTRIQWNAVHHVLLGPGFHIVMRGKGIRHAAQAY